MATVYRAPDPPSAQRDPGYSRYREPDTRIPPKAAPILSEVSVNGVAIGEAEILAEAQNHPAENPGQALQEAARALVVRQLLVQESRRLGIQVQPRQDQDGRRETEADAAIRVLIEQEVYVPSAAAEECRRYYENNRQKFITEPLCEARHILQAAPESDKGARKDAHDRASMLCGKIAASPALFPELAREYSDCPSAAQGGSLGQIGPGGTVTEFEAALANMEVGQISPMPVESRFGFHIIALDRRIAGRQLPYDMVADRIAAWLEASAWSKAIAQYIAILAAGAVICGVRLDQQVS